jgi:hypothetical protein
MAARSTATYFVLASHGWSGSNWAASALHQHPAITCTHSARNLLPSATAISCHAELARAAHVWDRAYKERTERPVDAVYDEIETLGATPVYGSVHTLRLRDLPVQIARFGRPRRTYRVANLVRHPLSFVWSGYGQLRDMFDYDPYVLHGSLSLVFATARDFVATLATDHGLNLCDRDVSAFICAAANLTNLARDLDVLPLAHWFKMEDLTSDRAAFANCVERLCAGNASVDSAYLDGVFGLQALNQHAHGTAMEPVARWQMLEPWQRDICRHYLSVSNIAPTYTALGYELGFI